MSSTCYGSNVYHNEPENRFREYSLKHSPKKTTNNVPVDRILNFHQLFLETKCQIHRRIQTDVTSQIEPVIVQPLFDR